MHGFEYEKRQGELGSWRAFTTLLAVDLVGELSSQELSLALFSFARRLAVACLHRPPEISPEKLRSDRWMEWTRPEQPIDRHRIAADLLYPLFKAGCVWITQDSIVAVVGSPLSFLKRKFSQRLYPFRNAGAGSGAGGSIDVRCRDEHALKLQWSVSGRQSFQGFTAPKKLVNLPTLNCCWWRGVGDVAGMTWESWDGNWRSCW